MLRATGHIQMPQRIWIAGVIHLALGGIYPPPQSWLLATPIIGWVWVWVGGWIRPDPPLPPGGGLPLGTSGSSRKQEFFLTPIFGSPLTPRARGSLGGSRTQRDWIAGVTHFALGGGGGSGRIPSSSWQFVGTPAPLQSSVGSGPVSAIPRLQQRVTCWQFTNQGGGPHPLNARDVRPKSEGHNFTIFHYISELMSI